MSKKDFNKGIQAGLRISEELLNKEAKAMDYLKLKLDGMALSQEEMKNAVNNILEFHTKDALEKYYGICNALSPKELQEPERKVLLDVLSTLAFQIDNFNKAQKLYLANLKHYLELVEYNPNVNYDFELIDNIRDLDSQEIILKCIREFMFLEEEDFAFVESIEDLLELFSVKPKVVRKIDDCISITYYLFGKDGVIEMYGNHNFEGIFDDEESEEAINLELEEIKLSGNIVINKGETKKFENKVIHFDCKIDCYGELIFENCKLLYDKGKTITMYDNSNIEIGNCYIKGIIKEGRWDYFINTFGCYNISTKIINSIIKESNWFMQNGSDGEIYINSCEILNCNTLFSFCGSVSVMKDCLIKCEEKIDENHILYREYDKELISVEGIEILNCKFEGYKAFDYHTEKTYAFDSFINGQIKKLYNCSFYKLATKLCAKDVRLCEFTECLEVLDEYSLMEDREIRDCTFIKCKEVILSLLYNLKVHRCQFLECEGRVIQLSKDSTIEKCGFYNIKGERCISIEARASEKYGFSTMKNCKFYGINLKDAFLISASCHYNKDSEVLFIDECEMKNAKIANKKGKAIDDTYTHFGLFNKATTKIGVKLRDCSGFDNISDKEGIYNGYVINEKNKNGESIGCSDDIKPGIAGKISNCISRGLATVKI